MYTQTYVYIYIYLQLCTYVYACTVITMKPVNLGKSYATSVGGNGQISVHMYVCKGVCDSLLASEAKKNECIK